MIIDTHIHLDRFVPEYDVKLGLNAARDAGISRFLVPGVNRSGWPAVEGIVSRTDGAMAAYGLHPQAVGEWDEGCRDELIGYLQKPETVAVGEIGLDRFVPAPVELQEHVLRQQLQIAVACSRPVLIHCRKMPGRLLDILAEEQADRVGGIMHAFAGSDQTAKMAMDLGFALSFGGALTYPEARRVIEVARELPDDAIVVETDAPDLSPHPHRGEVNQPAWLILVLQRLAEIRGWSFEEAAAITTVNARRVLNLD